MLLTEEQARRKECRAAPPVQFNGAMRRNEQTGEMEPMPGFERPMFLPCVASNCMMWRWVRKPNPHWTPAEHAVSAFYPPRDARNDPPPYIEDTTRGYCGLAGRPEGA